jgi:hypothetical protein
MVSYRRRENQEYLWQSDKLIVIEGGTIVTALAAARDFEWMPYRVY